MKVEPLMLPENWAGDSSAWTMLILVVLIGLSLLPLTGRQLGSGRRAAHRIYATIGKDHTGDTGLPP
jgi:glycerol uptake facilitator-like aquaporin